MTPFEYVSVLLSIVVSLALTHLLIGITRIIKVGVSRWSVPLVRVADPCRRVSAPLSDRRQMGWPDNREGPRIAWAKGDQSSEGGQPLEDRREHRCFPSQLQVGDEPGDEDDVERPRAHDLVGDAEVAAARVSCRRSHASARPGLRSETVPDPPRQNRTL